MKDVGNLLEMEQGDWLDDIFAATQTTQSAWCREGSLVIVLESWLDPLSGEILLKVLAPTGVGWIFKKRTKEFVT